MELFHTLQSQSLSHELEMLKIWEVAPKLKQRCTVRANEFSDAWSHYCNNSKSIWHIFINLCGNIEKVKSWTSSNFETNCTEIEAMPHSDKENGSFDNSKITWSRAGHYHDKIVVLVNIYNYHNICHVMSFQLIFVPELKLKEPDGSL